MVDVKFGTFLKGIDKQKQLSSDKRFVNQRIENHNFSWEKSVKSRV